MDYDKQLLKKWIIAIKRDNFTPLKGTKICSEHFLPSDYYPSSRELRKNSVSSVFDFPDHLRKQVNERVPWKRLSANEIQYDPEHYALPPGSPQLCKKSKHSSPTKEGLKEKLENQQKEIKSLQQQIRRKNKKVETLSEIVRDLRDKKLLSDDSSKNLEQYFSGLSAEIIKNHFKNQNKATVGRRHSDEAKRFAMTLHFYSPRAYELVRTVFTLPHASSIDCEVGFFIDVFKELQGKILSKTLKPECALLCDGMKIRSSVMYNKTTGSFEGFVNLGKDIVTSEEDVIATEAIVFMLVGLRGHWKCPIRYICTYCLDKRQ